jgi:hypothetical protein
VARRLDAMSRAAHRFHRFAHHPLCDEYAGEIVRLGRRARVCRGCLYVWGGGLVGMGASFVASIPVAVGAALLGVAAAHVVVTTLLRTGPRRSKSVTRLVPASAMGFAMGSGLRAGGAIGFTLVAVTALVVATLSMLYRRRGPDRTPCTTCPERLGSKPCRGFSEIVHRERAFRRLASRVLARAGVIACILICACEDPCPDLVKRENQRLAAIPAGDTAALEGLLADDYLLTFGNGVTWTKGEFLTHVRALPESARQIRETVEETQCRVHGNAAVVTGVVVVATPGPKGTSTKRARLTDTWMRSGSAWRLVAAHVNEPQ